MCGIALTSGGQLLSAISHNESALSPPELQCLCWSIYNCCWKWYHIPAHSLADSPVTTDSLAEAKPKSTNQAALLISSNGSQEAAAVIANKVVVNPRAVNEATVIQQHPQNPNASERYLNEHVQILQFWPQSQNCIQDKFFALQSK